MKTVEQVERDLVEKLERDKWLTDSHTIEFLKGLEAEQKRLYKILENLVDTNDPQRITLLGKETQTLTKVLNYARKNRYSTDPNSNSE